jgi:hypothetical protein
MSSIRRIRQQFEESDKYLETWLEDVRKSRIVVRSNDTSYIDKVGVYISTICRRQVEELASNETLIQDYDGLTEEDLIACLKFVALRAKRKL